MCGVAVLSEINRLWKAVQDLQRRVTQRPDIILPYTPIRTILIKDGNTLDTEQLGVAYSLTGVNTVPSAYDPNVDSSFIDGIGRGTLYINGVAQDGYVLVVNDSRSSFGHALLGDNADEDGPDLCWAFSEVAIPVDAGGSVAAWVVG